MRLAWILGGLALAAGCRLQVPDGQRCAVEESRRRCTREVTTLPIDRVFPRKLFHQTPLGRPPEEGWPAVVLFQGSFTPARRFYKARRSGPFGAWEQTGVVQALLESGFAVLTPNAQGSGRGFWNTNVLPWSRSWNRAPDRDLVVALLAAMDAGQFGELDPNRRYAAGISSGGYMTSRMALSHPGAFRALAIQSASWATCSGPACTLPEALPSDHPPTLFLHGERDEIVPIRTMERYADALEEAGHPVRVVTDPEAGHRWLEGSPEEIAAWFEAH